jgi:O-antigen/teichoic acid export membrane protein
MSKINAAIYNIVTQGSNFFLTLILSVILVPLYLQYFGLDVYGAWLASGNIIALLGVLESGLSFVLTQKLSVAQQNNNADFFPIFINGTLIFFLISICILTIGLLLLPYIPTIVQAPLQHRTDLIWGILFSILATVITVIMSPFGIIPQVYLKTFVPGIFNLLGNMFSAITVIIALKLGFGVASIGLGYLVRAIIISLGNVFYSIHLLKNITNKIYKFEKNKIFQLFKEILIPFLSRLAVTLSNNTQNLIIAAFISPTLTAIYDLTSKVTITLKSLTNIISISTFGGFSLTFADKDSNKLLNTVSKFLLIYSIPMALFYGFSLIFTPTILKYWVGISKFGGYDLLFFIVLSAVASDYLSLSNMFAWSSGFYKKGAIYDIVNVIIYLILVIVFINILGYKGIPLASFFSTIFILFLFYINILSKLGLTVKIFFSPFVKPYITIAILSLIIYIYLMNVNNMTIINESLSLITYLIMFFTSLLIFSKSHKIAVKEIILNIRTII